MGPRVPEPGIPPDDTQESGASREVDFINPRFNFFSAFHLMFQLFSSFPSTLHTVMTLLCLYQRELAGSELCILVKGFIQVDVRLFALQNAILLSPGN